MKNPVKFGLMGATALMIALSATTPTMAKPRGGMQFDQLDTNSDGFVDKAELIAARDARFDAMDADKDGAVTKEEAEAHRKAMREEMKAQHAKDGKEKKEAGKERKERGEKRADRGQMFDKMDTDNNGSLSKEEFEAAQKHHGKRDGRKAHRGDRMMAKMDANKDGKITRDELGTDMADRMIKHLDTDGDGKISKAEAEAKRGKKHGRGE
ncbi:MAG: calcium sensor EFh [Rhodobacteraceae bacterium]|nr:calcium sensor EFh [Paracoccaceae bacterium]